MTVALLTALPLALLLALGAVRLWRRRAIRERALREATRALRRGR